jgi:transposase
MDVLRCSGCLERDARIAELERRLAALEARLKADSSNSSVPPSSNPLGGRKPVVKKKSKRRRGGQQGHPPYLKQLLPPERVDHVQSFVPEQCEQCAAALPAEPSANDPEPKRFQTVELPPIVVVVKEYQGHARTCRCGHVTYATIPADIRAHSVGPRLTATLSYFTGNHGLSKRGVEEIAANVFGAPVSLGTVANLEQEVSAALAAPHQEALRAVQAAHVKHADETSWKLMGKLRWLWAAAATAGVVAFVIHGKRGALGLAALLGQEIKGILCSDRWHVYNQVPAARRQICWAHLKRDFQKIIDLGGAGGSVGQRGKRIVKRVFAAWQEFQEGRCTRKQLQTRMEPIMQNMNRILIAGYCGDDPKVEKFCANLLKLEPALWTFVTTDGVEPTNNFMERLLRRAVLWRKRSFGCWSEEGCRFVERILTVVQTRRLQDKNVLDYLHAAVLAHRTGKPCPTLLCQ